MCVCVCVCACARLFISVVVETSFTVRVLTALSHGPWLFGSDPLITVLWFAEGVLTTNVYPGTYIYRYTHTHTHIYRYI